MAHSLARLLPAAAAVLCLAAQAQQAPVAVVRVPCVENREPRKIVGGERHLAVALRLRADQPDRPARRAVGLHGLHPHGLAE